jgi:hypothetical protein
MNYAYVNSLDFVTATVFWDGLGPVPVPAGETAAVIPDGSDATINWTYSGGVFSPPTYWYSTVTANGYQIGQLIGTNPPTPQPPDSTDLTPLTPATGQTLQWDGAAWVLASFDITLSLADAKTYLINTTRDLAASAVDAEVGLYSGVQLINAPDVNALETKTYPGTTLGEYQTYVDGLTATTVAQINAATTVPDLYPINPAAIPFAPAVSGVMNTSRTGLDFNPSTYTTFTSTTLTPAETELFIPATSTVLTYGQFIPGQFDSPGNCFTTGNYTVLIRQVSTGFVLAQFIPPAGANVDVAF